MCILKNISFSYLRTKVVARTIRGFVDPAEGEKGAQRHRWRKYATPSVNFAQYIRRFGMACLDLRTLDEEDLSFEEESPFSDQS